MNCGDVLPVVLAVLPVAGALVGFAVSDHYERKRQAIQRAHDGDVRRYLTTRGTLVDLQRALARVRDGSGIAALMHSTSPRTGIDAARAALTEPWLKDWMAAAGEVSILTAQIQNANLIERARAIGVNQQEVLEARGDPEQIQAILDQLETAYDEANTLAGQLIQELDASQP